MYLVIFRPRDGRARRASHARLVLHVVRGDAARFAIPACGPLFADFGAQAVVRDTAFRKTQCVWPYAAA